MRRLCELEQAVDRLLPRPRMDGRPDPGLLRAAEAWSREAWRLACGRGPLVPDDAPGGLALAQRPVFVCGAHRTGTTLMRDLLDGHPALAVLPSEGSWLTSLRARLGTLPPEERAEALGCEWLRRLANPAGQEPYWIAGRSSADGSPYVEFARRLLGWWDVLERRAHPHFPHAAVALAWADTTGRNLAQTAWWAEKTPLNELHADALFRAHPAARVIQMVRHPVDVWASRRRLEERVFGGFPGRRAALRQLRDSLRIAAARRTDPRWQVVRLEELTADRRAVMESAAAFLGVSWEEILLMPQVAGRPAQPNTSFVGPGEARGGGLLDRRETAMLRGSLGAAAIALGYAL